MGYGVARDTRFGVVRLRRPLRNFFRKAQSVATSKHRRCALIAQSTKCDLYLIFPERRTSIMVKGFAVPFARWQARKFTASTVPSA